MALHCTLCGSSSHARSSREDTPGLKDTYYQCTNIKCGATFRAREQFVCFISRPAPVQLSDEEVQKAFDECDPTDKARRTLVDGLWMAGNGKQGSR